MRSTETVSPHAQANSQFTMRRAQRRLSHGYLLAIAGSIAAVAVAGCAQKLFGLNDLSPVFMLAVLAVAARTRTGPAVLAAILCFLGYNYFFFEPRFSFYISGRRDVATIVLFLAAALLAGRLASRLGMQIQALRNTNWQVHLRQELGQRLAAAADEPQVLEAARDFFQRNFGADIRVTSKNESVESTQDETTWHAVALGTHHDNIGSIRLGLPRHNDADAAMEKLIDPALGDVAQAILRSRLVADLQSVRIANETERLRSALLSSVSHDLRTPLAGILGAAESLDTYGNEVSIADRHELLGMIREEGQRLDRYIENLLDMTRLGRGELALNRDWIGIDELIGSALRRLHPVQPGATFHVSVAADIEPVWVHPALIEQALFNVLENASKFSPADKEISVDARRDSANSVRIEVHDDGPGISAEDRERIFEMFYTVARGDRNRNGTGLGLAICRGMVAAHGGSVEAISDGTGGGTTIRITLPLIKPDATSSAA
ncbi:MAG: ATP-binding protein [Rudaea sp.]